MLPQLIKQARLAKIEMEWPQSHSAIFEHLKNYSDFWKPFIQTHWIQIPDHTSIYFIDNHKRIK